MATLEGDEIYDPPGRVIFGPGKPSASYLPFVRPTGKNKEHATDVCTKGGKCVTTTLNEHDSAPLTDTTLEHSPKVTTVPDTDKTENSGTHEAVFEDPVSREPADMLKSET